MALLSEFSRRMRRNAKAPSRFLTDRSGATMVEFAMIAVPFIGLISAIFETGNVYFKTSQLQVATETASRNVLVHSAANGMTYQQFINNYVCTHGTNGTVQPGTLGMMFDCSKVLVNIAPVASWGGSYSNNFYTNPNAGNAVITMPPPGTIAVVQVVYPVSSVAAVLSGGVFKGQSVNVIRSGQVQYSGNGGNWSYMIMGIYAFRVEPT